MIEWVMIVQLAMTGQPAAVSVESEMQCRAFLAQIEAGVGLVIRTTDGVILPIAKGIGCRQKTDEEKLRDRARVS